MPVTGGSDRATVAPTTTAAIDRDAGDGESA